MNAPIPCTCNDPACWFRTKCYAGVGAMITVFLLLVWLL